METARKIGAERQPDEFQYCRAFESKRVLLTQDKDYLDNERFPLQPTRAVVLLNVDTASTAEIRRALEVVAKILAGIAPVLHEAEVVVNADFTLTFIRRVSSTGDFTIRRDRYRLDENGLDIWIWENDR